MSKFASAMQIKLMPLKYRGKEVFKPHDPDAPWDGHDESDDTEQKARSVRLARQKWMK